MHTIMLIDDDPTMLRLLSTLLQIEGFQPVAWSGEQEVVPEIRLARPDIIMLDVNLKGLNGIDVLKQVRLDPVLAAVPVLMTSGIDYTAECLAAGANAFFVKPYMPDILIRSIQTYLAQEA